MNRRKDRKESEKEVKKGEKEKREERERREERRTNKQGGRLKQKERNPIQLGNTWTEEIPPPAQNNTKP